MKPLPLPVRVAAGLAVIAVEQAQKLPEQLVGLPVTITSQAMQLAMKAQQQITELAIKGDEVIAGLRPAEEQPEWATFDEDLDEAEQDFAAPVSVPAPVRPAQTVTLPIAGYDELSIAQLRARLRQLSIADLQVLLDHEQGNQVRPDFLRMLGNRIATVRGQ
ncbi:lipid droplet-associated protein [Pseudonocardiaceae bacterium YIM PH 21723]|nr:lipid droplet-associated protein [Pseudonocardiaceae bacterium YIM PH 21723]